MGPTDMGQHWVRARTNHMSLRCPPPSPVSTALPVKSQASLHFGGRPLYIQAGWGTSHPLCRVWAAGRCLLPPLAACLAQPQPICVGGCTWSVCTSATCGLLTASTLWGPRGAPTESRPGPAASPWALPTGSASPQRAGEPTKGVGPQGLPLGRHPSRGGRVGKHVSLLLLPASRSRPGSALGPAVRTRLPASLLPGGSQGPASLLALRGRFYVK